MLGGFNAALRLGEAATVDRNDAIGTDYEGIGTDGRAGKRLGFGKCDGKRGIVAIKAGLHRSFVDIRGECTIGHPGIGEQRPANGGGRCEQKVHICSCGKAHGEP